MSVTTAKFCALTLIAGLVSACGSGNDATVPDHTRDPVASDIPLSDNPVEIGTEEGAGESDVAETDFVQSEPDNSGSLDSVPNQTGSADSGENTTENDTADSQNDGEPENTDSQGQEQADPESEPEQGGSEPPAENPQRATMGSPKLLVDLVPGGGSSYPAKFHRSGDKLYFWTVDEDPRFARCAWHWFMLDDEDKNIGFNFVATHPDTGEIAMNKRMMTVGDFAEDVNHACAGYNSSIMHVYDQIWLTQPAANGEQQFILHFDSFNLGPDRLWKTDGSENNTRLVETGQFEDHLIVEGDKIFFVNENGLSVADSLSSERRSLFTSSGEFYHENVQSIENSLAREATFEIKVAENRYQIWSYNLDTDEWEKTFSIKPDDNTYLHLKTLLVSGQTVLSLGRYLADGDLELGIQGRLVLGISSNYGDVTSFEILTEETPSPYDVPDRINYNDLVYFDTDHSVDPAVTSIWRFREDRIENIGSIAEGGLWEMRMIRGQNSHIFLTAIKSAGEWPETSVQLKLWAYDSQNERWAELSNDDWYAVIGGHPSPDEGYVFRYLNTPEGLIFVNLTQDSGRELWFSDGTNEGTRQLADINPGSADSNPQNFYYSGDAIYFSADDGVHGREPWRIPISR